MSFDKVTLVSLIILSQSVWALQNRTEFEDIREMELGETVVLKCYSNDANHNFMFWHSAKNGMIIGPRNQFNNNKFKYEVLSGNLTIRGITPNEEGVYNCVSDGVTFRDILVYSVKVVIKRNSQSKPRNQALQQNYDSNLWKTCAVLGSILLSLIIILVVLHMYHKTDKPHYFDIGEENDDDEDSTEELFTREPSTSGKKSPVKKDETADNFEKVYTAINLDS